MASDSSPQGAPEPRPGSLRSTKSFPRQPISEPDDPLKSSPKRANTFHDGMVPEITIAETSSLKETPPNSDTFESESNEELIEPPRASVDMDEIPIELVSMIDK